MRIDGQRSGDERGFTLIELLVVVIIIGVLASIAIPLFSGQQAKAHRASVVSDLRNAATAVETYAAGPGLGSYAGMEGATESASALTDQGFNRSEWVSVRVFATPALFCIQGENSKVPGRLFVYRSSSGVVDVLADRTNDCNSSLG